jgi:hypothetical protein
MKENVPIRVLKEGKMDLLELNNLLQTGAVGLLVILVGMIKIPKVELNIWNWIGRTIGSSINKEVMDQVKDLSTKVDSIETNAELERVRYARQRILRFNDEILCNQKHSKEHFDEVLDDIDVYEDYCATHENYENNKAVLAIKTIKKTYDKCMENHNFLAPQKMED